MIKNADSVTDLINATLSDSRERKKNIYIYAVSLNK